MTMRRLKGRERRYKTSRIGEFAHPEVGDGQVGGLGGNNMEF